MSNNFQKQPLILGISCFYHDASAVLLDGDKIISAVQEERFTRKKFDNSFPVHSISYCLKTAQIEPQDIDCIAFYEEPYAKLDRLIETQTFYGPLHFIRNYKRITHWIRNKLNVEQQIDKALPTFKGKLIFFHHHSMEISQTYSVNFYGVGWENDIRDYVRIHANLIHS